MSNLAVSNTFVALSTILSADVNTNFSDIVSYVNNRNSASAAWDQLSVAGNAAIVGTLTNTGAVTFSSTLGVTGNITSSAITFLADGSAAAPSLALTNGTTTGFYKAGTATLGIATVGVARVSFSAATVDVSGSAQLALAVGTVSAPGIAFSSELGTGLYRIASQNLGVAVSGTKFVDAKTAKGFSIKGSDGTVSADAGFVGEYISSSVTTTATMASTGTFGNITSIDLTAGDWDVTGSAWFDANGATTSTGYATAVSINSGNTTTDHVNGDNVLYGTTAALAAHASTTVHYRLLVTGATTVYLKTMASFSGGPPKTAGTIKARRVR